MGFGDLQGPKPYKFIGLGDIHGSTPAGNRRVGAQIGPQTGRSQAKKGLGRRPQTGKKPIPLDFGPVSGCLDHDPKLLDCEIAQPRTINIELKW